MSRAKPFKLNKGNFSKEVMKADFTVQLIAETVEEITEKANAMGKGEYVGSYKAGRKRALGMVRADDFKARKDDDENNTLQKAAYPLQVVNK